jgi:hypothetical protein
MRDSGNGGEGQRQGRRKTGFLGLLIIGFAIFGGAQPVAAYGLPHAPAMPGWDGPASPMGYGRPLQRTGPQHPRLWHRFAARQRVWPHPLDRRRVSPGSFPLAAGMPMGMAPPRFAAPYPYRAGFGSARYPYLTGFARAPAPQPVRFMPAPYPRVAGLAPGPYPYGAVFPPVPPARPARFVSARYPRAAGVVTVPYLERAGFASPGHPVFTGPSLRYAAAPVTPGTYAGRLAMPRPALSARGLTVTVPSRKGRFQPGTYRFRPVDPSRVTQVVLRHNGRDWHFWPIRPPVAALPSQGHVERGVVAPVPPARPSFPASSGRMMLATPARGFAALPPGFTRPFLPYSHHGWKWRPVRSADPAPGLTVATSRFRPPPESTGLAAIPL